MNKFDQNIKDALDSFEPDFNPADWNAMEKKLDKVQGSSSGSSMKPWLIAASVVGAVAAAVYFWPESKEQAQDVIQNQHNVAEVIATPQANQELQPEQQSNITDNNSNNKSNTTTQAQVSDHNQTETPVNNNAEQSNEQNENKEVKTEQPVNSATPLKNNQMDTQPMLTADFSAPDNGLCQGAALRFQPNMIAPGIKYEWSFGDGSKSDEVQPAHAYSEAGKYTVKLKVSDASGQFKFEKKYVTVNASPAIRVDAEQDGDNYLQYTFAAIGSDVQTWYWEFGDRSKSNEPSPVHVYAKKGTYKVTLAATSNYGCRASISKDVEVKHKLNLLAPNAFSPNGDGNNETWMPVALAEGDYQFTLTVLDLSGKVVYQTSDKYQPWTGKDAKIGEIYTWKATVMDQSGDTIVDQGLITITK